MTMKSAPEGPFAQQGPSTDVEANKLRLTAAALRRTLKAQMVNEGIGFYSDLLVSQDGAGTGKASIAAGDAFVLGDSTTDQGMYQDTNDAAYLLDVLGPNPPHATLDRIDLVVARVRDTYYGDGENTMKLEAITGTPAGSPSPPALPGSALFLAQLLVRHTPNTQILTADITDKRPVAGRGRILLGKATANGVATMTLSPIAQNFEKLTLILYGKTDAAGSGNVVRATLNGDSAVGNYDSYAYRINTSTVAVVGETYGTQLPVVGAMEGVGGLASVPGIIVVEFPGYAGTNFHKIFSGFGNHQDSAVAGGFSSDRVEGRWRSTAPITSILLTQIGGNFINAVALLYGE